MYSSLRNTDIKISSERNRAFDFINEIYKKKYYKAEPKLSIEFGRAVLSAIFTSRENYEITFAILCSKRRDRNNFLLSRPYWKNLHIGAGQKPSRPFFNPLLLVRVPLKAVKKNSLNFTLGAFIYQNAHSEKLRNVLFWNCKHQMSQRHLHIKATTFRSNPP